MSDVIGRGVIELVADARGIRAGVEEAKKSIRTLGQGQKDISASASKSIDQYIGRLQAQNAMLGKSVREQQLFKLALRGASDEQLKLADAALKVGEAHDRSIARAAQMRSAFTAIGTAAGLAAAGYVAMTGRQISFLASLEDMSKSTGVAATDLAGINLAARLSGTSLETVAQAINRMSVEIGKDPDAFRKLGVDAKDNVEAFKQLSDIFVALEDTQQRNALAQKVFGKSWAELGPILSEGSQSIGEMIDRGKKLSGVTEDLIKQAAAADDAFEELNLMLSAFAGTTFIPTISTIARELLNAANNANSFRDGIARFFSISGAEASKPVEALEEVDKRLASLKKTQAELQGMSGLKRLFSADDIAIVNEQIERATRAREQLLLLQPPRAPTGFDADDVERGAAFRGAAAARNAKVFLQDPRDPKEKKPSSDNSAERLQRAQFAAQLDAIKRFGDQSIAEYERAQRITEALRSADLLDEQDTFEARRGFLLLTTQAREKALQEEITLLQSQKFAGKDAAAERVENDRKIADVQAQLAKVRADAVAEGLILDAQQRGSLNKLQQAYDDATQAARENIASIQRRNALELAGIGKGTQFRERAAGVGDIEGRFIDRRQQLEGEKRRREITQETFDIYLAQAKTTYDTELALYTEHSIALEARSRDWTVGASEALANYAAEASNTAKIYEEVWTNALRRTEDALTQFLDTGKLDVRSFVQSIGSDLNRAFVREQITGPLADKLKDGKLLESVGGLLTGKSIGTQAPAPVENRSAEAAQAFLAGGSSIASAASAVDAGTLTASIAAAGTAFSTEAAAAGVSLSSSIATSGITFNTETIAAATTMTTAATTFSGIVTAAGTTFASSVAAASAGSGGSAAAGGIASVVPSVLDSFAEGTDYVPRTGLYQLHAGERVMTAEENRRAFGSGTTTINVTNNFPPGTDRALVDRAAGKVGIEVQRQIRRGTSF